MLRRDASALFRSVLLLSAVGTACGGAIEPQPAAADDDPSPEKGSTSSSGGGSSGGWSSSSSSSGSTSSSTSSGGSTSSSSGSTSSSSSSSSGSTSSSSSGSSGTLSCKTGSMDFSTALCCAPGATCPTGPWGGDSDDAGVGCTVDCVKVCEAVGTGLGGAMEYCGVMADGRISYACGACGVGRLPGDTTPCPLGETLGERLARQAYYEAVSVVAFERLVATLEAAGAPRSLVARARGAAEDEARHAALFRDLAAAHGAETRPVTMTVSASTLFELALENATEGCVRETLGAVFALHQSMHAELDVVRAAYAAICDDEAEHAALSWELKAWFDAQLSAPDRARVEAAHLAAIEAARREACEPPDAQGLALGLPDAPRARRMLDLVVEAMADAA